MCRCADRVEGDGVVHANAWIAAVLGQCIYTPRDMASFVLGWLSIVFWLCAHFPQVRVNVLLRTANGLSLPFVILWLCADTLNSVASVVTGQLFTSIALFVYTSVMDLVFLVQFVVFEFVLTKRGCSPRWLARHEARRRRRAAARGGDRGDRGDGGDSALPQEMIESADVPSAPEATCSSGKPSVLHTAQNSRAASACESTSLLREAARRRTSFIDSVRAGSIMGEGGAPRQVRSLLRARADSIAAARRGAVQQMAALAGAADAAAVPLTAGTADGADGADRPPRRTSWTCGGVVTLVVIVALVVLALFFASMWAFEVHRDDTAECGAADPAPGVYWFGYAVAWVCAVLYSAAGAFGARHVVRSKQSADKTPAFFLCTGMGNLAFFLSIVVVVGADNVVSRLPYIVSNFCSDVLYWTNFALIVYYKRHPGGRRAACGPVTGGGPSASPSSTDNDGAEDIPKLEEPSAPLPPAVVVVSSSSHREPTALSSDG